MSHKTVSLYLAVISALWLTACGAPSPTVEPTATNLPVPVVKADTPTPPPTATEPAASTPPIPELPPLPAEEFAKLEQDATNLMIRARPKCFTCHRLGDQGNDVGPHLTEIGAVAAGRIPGLSARAYIEQSILEPDAFIVPNCPDGPCGKTKMSSYNGQFNEKKLDTLVTYLTYLTGPN